MDGEAILERPDPTKETCSACRFFKRDAMECRRNAPVPQGHRQVAQWPKVTDAQWCGQFERSEILSARRLDNGVYSATATARG